MPDRNFAAASLVLPNLPTTHSDSDVPAIISCMMTPQSGNHLFDVVEPPRLMLVLMFVFLQAFLVSEVIAALRFKRTMETCIH